MTRHYGLLNDDEYPELMGQARFPTRQPPPLAGTPVRPRPVPQPTIWDRIRTGAERLMGIPQDGLLSPEDSSYAFRQGLLSAGAGIVESANSGRGLPYGISQGITASRGGAASGLEQRDALKQRQAAMQQQEARFQFMEKYRTADKNDPTVLSQMFNDAVALGLDQEMKSIAEVIKARQAGTETAANIPPQGQRWEKQPDGTWQMVAENKNVTSSAANIQRNSIDLRAPDGTFHRYAFELDPETGKMVRVDLGESRPSGVDLTRERGSPDQRKAGFQGARYKAAYDKIVPLAKDPNVVGEVSNAITAIEGLGTAPWGWGEALTFASRAGTQGQLSSEGQVLLNNVFEVLATEGFGSGGAQLTAKEWSIAIRKLAPLAGESSASWKDKLARMDRGWKGYRNTAGPEVWGRAVQGVTADDEPAPAAPKGPPQRKYVP